LPGSYRAIKSLRAPRALTGKSAVAASKAGFTLIEVLVSIVLTSVIALLVFGAVQAARDTQARSGEEWRSMQRSVNFRLFIVSALAGSQSSLLESDSVFVLENRVGPRGIPQDRLTFVTSGDIAPLSPGADWQVSMRPTSNGLRVQGRPIGTRLADRILGEIPGITGLAIRVQDASFGVAWSDQWAFPTSLPDAVELTYWTETGPIGDPIRVALALGTGQ
jgi:prepilin-type N-terminal cleavage/methylation domain-containing protein